MIPYLALKASAGSGKTFSLSVRYIALILKKERASNIIALTFTKKAAAQMSQRIVSTFLNLKKEEKEAELAELCSMLNMSKDAVLARVEEIKDEFLSSNLKIMTFDSFFGSVLRSFSLNLGLSPDYEIKNIDEFVIRSKFIKEVSANNYLLSSLAIYILEFSKGQNDFFETLLMLYENLDNLHYKLNLSYPDNSRVLEICTDMKQFVQKNDGSDRAIKSFEISSVDDILQKDFLARDSLNYTTFSKVFKNAKNDDLDVKFAELKQELKSYLDELEAYKIRELAQFLEIYKRIRQEQNAKQNVLTFSDVTKLTARLLGQIDNEMLYFRLDGTIKHLLIDEFQDTNVTQYDIMYPLISEIVSGQGQNGIGSFFYVGDTKQSIYRFRGGKKELFDKLAGDFKQIYTDSLDTNYRSARLLVEFVNSVFGTKIDGFKDQKAHRSDDGYIEISDSDDIVGECVKKVQFLLDKGVCSSDITVLCWKNSDINEICFALKNAKINASDEGAMLLTNSPLVFVLLNYAKFCIFGDKIFAKNVSSYLGYEPPKVDIDLKKTPQQSLYYLAKMAKISLRDLDVLKLLELSLDYGDIIKFLSDCDNIETQAALNDAFGVRVMTVHKSKGLEFKHVILCDKLGKGKGDTDKFKIEYDLAKGWEVRLKANNRDYIDTDYADFLKHCKELDDAEEINKLYVAMTRAEDSMFIIKKQNPSGSNPSYFSKYRLKNGTQAGYLELESMLDGVLNLDKTDIKIYMKSPQKIELISVPRDDSKCNSGSDEVNLNAVYFGMALHFLLEMSEFSEAGVLYQKPALFNKFAKFLSIDELDDVLNRVLNLVKNDEFISLIVGKKIKKEQAINYKNELKQLDLLLLGDDEIIVVDYKSSDFNKSENINQVKEYTQILISMYPNLNVKGVIFYILKDKIYSLEIN